jgi:hypothetical protein
LIITSFREGGRAIKQAFLLLVHTHPEMLSRLVSRLQQPDAIFVVHVDGRSAIEPFREALRTQPNVYFITRRIRVRWCGFSTVQAILALLDKAWALRADRFTLISGQDYPAGNVAEQLASDNEMIGIDRRCYRDGDGWFDRCAYEYFLGDWRLFSLREGSSLMRWIAAKVAARLPRRRAPIPIYYGATWWSLTRGAVQRIRGFVEDNPRAVRWFRYCRAPDEMFFQSVLKHMGQPRLVYDQTMRSVIRPPHTSATVYVDFRGTVAGSPRCLDLSDLPGIRASDALFARKMDPVVSADLMDALDHI